MAKVQIFIATYNRPFLVVKALDSALNQSFNSLEVIVSDNSTNEDTLNLLQNYKTSEYKYIRRYPSLSAIAHLNAILDCVESEYFMIFHDDDIMYKDLIKTLYCNLANNDQLVAVGANAKIITQGIFTNRLMFRNKDRNLLITTRDQMAFRYLVKNGIVPFPSYLYKKSVSRKIHFDPIKGGKHCDVSFLMDLTLLGYVLMLKEPLMEYHISHLQDSNTNSFSDRIKIINYISKTTTYKNNSILIKKFRIVNLYYEIIQDTKNKKKLSAKRKIRILKLIFSISPFYFFPRAILNLIRIGLYRFGSN